MNRLIAEIGGAAVAVLLFVLLLNSQGTIGRLKDQLATCGRARDAAVQQIKDNAIEEGKRYAALEAQHLGNCRDAYDAGAKRLPDNQAVSAGRYVPRSGASPAHR